ncbi:hypothetical protein [Sediminitomix flava]|uniref:Uncharacterized protein n=1 Tax=Sediminitomix flava TaxID=379075 RepID=A0A315Z881_SEDFL|nr:hypothetical protein [Sediminitomix flava]PWJ41067.1 hypothetical protein BC781_104342 [Sediminitomix flava]
MNILFLAQLAAVLIMVGVVSLGTSLLMIPLNFAFSLGFLSFGLLTVMFAAFGLIPELIIAKNFWKEFKNWAETQDNWLVEADNVLYSGNWYSILVELTSFKKTLINKGLIASSIGLVNCFTGFGKVNMNPQVATSEVVNEPQLEEVA